MAREDERLARAQERPIVGSLPEVPGIIVAMSLTPQLGLHMRGLADALLVDDYPGATIGRAEREMIATAVSAGNDCFFCMDSHAAHAIAVLEREGRAADVPVIEPIIIGDTSALDARMQALIAIALVVRRDPRALTEADVRAALHAGATDADVQLAVLIAAGFSMYNRMVDGFRAMTPPAVEMYRERAGEIAEHGYGRPSERVAATARS
ncbi:MAG: carboxymuconolactone decarboxylase family protein [Chloroflexota bacterium]